ncbi:MAG: peptidase [Armatimonadota bacterium]
MARKDKQTKKESRLDRTRRHIEGAQRRLHRSLLGPLLAHITIVECDGNDENKEPMLACVDPEQGAIWINPHRRQELGEPEWTFVLAHQLLHLGLNHGPRRENREPFLWNIACDTAIFNLLAAFKIGTPPLDLTADTGFSGQREEEIYEQILLARRVLPVAQTCAGPGRPDIVRRPTVTARYSSSTHRKDYEKLLAEGIRRAVEDAVLEAAETFGDANDLRRTGSWPPAERARRWVLTEFPLLGALAIELRIVADAAVCDRMDIRIAAVSGYLGEIYLHPDVGLTDDELLFVYVHELLHVGLLHHTRCRGRDPLVWNLACDFVINSWLIEMGVGRVPAIGGLYDPRLQNKSAEEVYDLLITDGRKCRGLRGFRGGLGDVLLDTPGRRLYRGDVSTLDDVWRRCLGTGLSCLSRGRGSVPAGLVEEIRSLFTPPVPWDVELAHWMEAHVPLVREKLRTYARASRRQSSTPDIPRPARWTPQEWKDACTFGVILDTSGSMDRQLLGRALGAIASYAEAREVPAVRLILCDAAPYDRAFVTPTDLRGIFPIQGRGGTVLQPAVSYLLRQTDFPEGAPVMIITDGWCEEEIFCSRTHCFVLPRKGWKQGALPLRTAAPVFQVLKEDHEPD